tara:strand:- start:7566 stop:9407 length:1842 start_codon:yes stop_codon:yes gene_type:complete
MALTTTDFNVSFLLGGSSKVFKFTDITDYTSQGVSRAAITGRIKVTAPSGIVYDNLSASAASADIIGSASRVSSTSINVPLLSGGTPEVGLYTFEYRATNGNDPSVDTTVSKIKTFTYSYSKPKETNQLTADCLSPELKGADTTNYLVNAVTPNDRFLISIASSSTNTFCVSGEKVGFFTVGNKFDVISSTGNNGQYTITGVNYDKTNDKTVVNVAGVSSDTADGYIVQRRTTLYFTSVPGITPLVGYSSVLSTNSFYSQLQSFSFEAHVLYDFGGGITLSDSFSSSDSINVDCDDNLCDVFCCINTVFGEYMKYKCTNKTLADLALERYTIITSHLASLRTAYECGDSAAITSLTAQIKEVSQCNDDCGCTSGDPIPITGTGASATSVVASGGNGVNVATSVNGNETTYTLTLAQSVLDDITNATATSSVVSSDSSITVTSTTAGTNTEYNIKIPPATPIIPPKEFIVMKLEIENPNNTVSFTPKDVFHQNPTNLKNPTTAAWTYSEVSPLYSYSPYAIDVSSFQTSSNSTYKVDVSSYYQKRSVGGSGGGSTIDIEGFNYAPHFLKPMVVKIDNGSFRLYFKSPSKYFKPGEIFNSNGGYKKIYLTIKIYE